MMTMAGVPEESRDRWWDGLVQEQEDRLRDDRRRRLKHERLQKHRQAMTYFAHTAAASTIVLFPLAVIAYRSFM